MGFVPTWWGLPIPAPEIFANAQLFLPVGSWTVFSPHNFVPGAFGPAQEMVKVPVSPNADVICLHRLPLVEMARKCCSWHPCVARQDQVKDHHTEGFCFPDGLCLAGKRLQVRLTLVLREGFTPFFVKSSSSLFPLQ